jgi:hypothetical protein
MAILTIDFDEDEQEPLEWIIETFRERLEQGNYEMPNDMNAAVMSLIRTMHESVRAWSNGIHKIKLDPDLYEIPVLRGNDFDTMMGAYEEEDDLQL